MDIGEKIKEYRTSLKMTQADFAYRLGITGASVSAYENGTRLPSYEILVKISNILGVSIDDLLGKQNSGAITVDISSLTPMQRNIIQDLIKEFERSNKIELDFSKSSMSANFNYQVRERKKHTKISEE